MFTIISEKNDLEFVQSMFYNYLNVVSWTLQPILHCAGSLGCRVPDTIGDQARTVPKDGFWIRTTWHGIH